MEVAVSGHVAEMRHLCLHVPGVLGTTPQGNTVDNQKCSFCKVVKM